MSTLSPTVTLTPKTSPHICGVGDYTLNLATHCQSHLGHPIHLIVETTCDPQTHPVTIHPLVADWSPDHLISLFHRLQAARVGTVILQYTCFSYSAQGYNPHLGPFWQRCRQHFQTLLVVHETYNRLALRYPGTWALNPRQKAVLRRLVQASHQVFCGSEPYRHQLLRLGCPAHQLHALPIPNNIPPQPLSPPQKVALQQELGLSPDLPTLALFGCRESIYPTWLTRLDQHLRQRGRPIQWLLLGNAQKLTVPLTHTIARPGFLSAAALSHHLQLADILLMPHRDGISAKRTSLMAALEHGIPVVGTQGVLTDGFFHQLPSLFLAPDYGRFQGQLVATLDDLGQLGQALATTRRYYDEHLSWPAVVKGLEPYL
jgi:glycosyltransferase involved in cell wall biosynthesis